MTVKRVSFDDVQPRDNHPAPVYDVFLTRFDRSTLIEEEFEIPIITKPVKLDGQYACVLAPYYSRNKLHDMRLVVDGKDCGNGIFLYDSFLVTYMMLYKVSQGSSEFRAYIAKGTNPATRERCSPDFTLRYRDQASGNKRGYFCVATKTGHDSAYILQWIEYNLRLGVEHFYIYTHDSPQTIKLLQPYIARGQVTHLEWNYSSRNYPTGWYPRWPRGAVFYVQPPMQCHAIRAFGHLWDWMALIDCDEFLVHPVDSSIKKVLKSFERETASVLVPGKYFGNSHRRDVPPNIVEALTQCEPGVTSFPKTIVRPPVFQSHLNHWSSNKSVQVDPEVLRFNHYRSVGDNHRRRAPEHDNQYNGSQDRAAIELMRVCRA